MPTVVLSLARREMLLGHRRHTATTLQSGTTLLYNMPCHKAWYLTIHSPQGMGTTLLLNNAHKDMARFIVYPVTAPRTLVTVAIVASKIGDGKFGVWCDAIVPVQAPMVCRVADGCGRL